LSEATKLTGSILRLTPAAVIAVAVINQNDYD